MSYKLLQGDALEVLKTLEDKSVQTCITSPPYYGLRDYGVDGQIGMEETPEEYIDRLVNVFREVKRVLKDDGTLWVNIGDSYCSSNGIERINNEFKREGRSGASANDRDLTKLHSCGYKTKDLLGIPWKLAEALRRPYYCGTIKNATDRAWLASMMDGEGSFVLSSYNNKGRIKTNFYINLTNSSTKIIERCENLFPQEVRHVYKKPGVTRKIVYRWDVERLEKKELFIREIYPYIVEKRKQCIVGYTFLQLQKGMPNKKYGYTKDQQHMREELVDIMHKLNSGEDVDLPEYCQEPKSLYEQMFYLRQDIIWSKDNPLPESVTDRCTKSHEYIFLLSKSSKYYFDNEAIKEPATSTDTSIRDRDHTKLNNTPGRTHMGGLVKNDYTMRNKRDVWRVSVSPYKGAHFATYPEKLIEPCVLAGSNEGDTVLDVFNGSGTTGAVAIKHGRNYIGIDLNSDYLKLAENRLMNASIEKSKDGLW